MTVLVCWHRDLEARAAIRSAIPRMEGMPRVRTCRTADGVVSLLEGEVVDAVILDVKEPRQDLYDLAADYAAIPFFGYGTLRADDGRAIQRCQAAGFQGVFIRGSDDAVLWRLLAPHTSRARRRRAFADAPKRLRMTERFQVEVWNEVLRRETESMTTQDIADAIGVTREHLSREFGAGGAPNLKRVIDLVRVACAADILRCRAYSVVGVARLLRWRSATQMNATAQRVAGDSAAALAEVGVREIVRKFSAGRTRSRL